MALAALIRQPVLITTRLIIIETVSLLTKRLSPFHARAWHEAFSKGKTVEIREFDPNLFTEAEEFWKSHKDKHWDLIDCYSFCIMRTEKIREAFTFDQHYRQAGFKTLLCQKDQSVT